MENTQLMRIDRQFLTLDHAKNWLAACTDIDRIRQIRRAAQLYEREAFEAGILRLYSERRLGQVLLQVDLSKGGRPATMDGGSKDKEPVPESDRFRLKEIGVTKKDSAAFQVLATMPAAKLDTLVAKFETTGRPPSARRIASEWKIKNRQTTDSTPSFSSDPALGDWATSLEPLALQVTSGTQAPFGCIYADPPWQYGNQGTRGAAGKHYDTMSLEAIMGLPVRDLAAPQSLLWLWATASFLRQSFDVIEAWGFQYKANAIWYKANRDRSPFLGLGNYVRLGHEILMIGSRGGQLTDRRDQGSWLALQFDRTHSTKPDVFRRIVQRNSPGPWLELFGRKRVKDWTVFGNDDRTLTDHAQLEWLVGDAPKTPRTKATKRKAKPQPTPGCD